MAISLWLPAEHQIDRTTNHEGEPPTMSEIPQHVVDAVPGITFLSSDTVTDTHRERDGDTQTHVEHTARFAIEPGTLADMKPYGSCSYEFRPAWLEATWDNGEIRVGHVSGRRVLKGGQLSHADTRPRYTFYADGRYGNSYPMPELVRTALTAYETAVAVASNGAHPSDGAQ